MKPCQVDWQKLVFQGKKYSVPEKIESLMNIKQNEKSTCILISCKGLVMGQNLLSGHLGY